MSSGKIIGLLLVIGLIVGGGYFLLIDHSGDGLRTYRQTPLIGNVEGDPLEYDTSGDGLSDGQVHEMGLNPTESYPAIVKALEGGMDAEEAGLFVGIDPVLVENVAGLLVENSDYLAAVRGDGEVSELAVYSVPKLSPGVVGQLAVFSLNETTERLVEVLQRVDSQVQVDYIEAVARGGRVSELGVYSIPYLDVEAVEQVAGVSRTESNERLVKALDNMSPEGQVDYIEAVVRNGQISEIGLQYMENFDPEVLENVAPVEEPTERNVRFLENLSELPEPVRDNLAREYAANGRITKGQLDQIHFLHMLAEEDELQDYIQNFDLTNQNVSGDGFTNHFSRTQSDILNWDKKNDVYMLSFDHGPELDAVVNLTETYEIPDNRTYMYNRENATYKAFLNTVDNLTGRTDEDDMVFLHLSGHGAKGYFGFAIPPGQSGTTGVSYSEIADKLDGVGGHQVVVVDSCYSGSAIPYLESEDRAVLTSTDAESEDSPWTLDEPLMETLLAEELDVVISDGRVPGGYNFSVDPDLDGNGYVSLDEAWRTQTGLRKTFELTPEEYREKLREELGELKPLQPLQGSDPGGIMDDFFLGQVEPKEEYTQGFNN